MYDARSMNIYGRQSCVLDYYYELGKELFVKTNKLKLHRVEPNKLFV